MLKAYIVDDEPLARDELGYLLRRSRKAEVVGEAESLETALAQIQELQPDIVFLDIQLAEQNGMDLARRLAELNLGTEVVFATAYDEYALQAFELNAVDYILKPYDEQRILQTLEKAAKRRELRHNRESGTSRTPSPGDKIEKLAIYAEDRILLIPVNRIITISSADGKTVITTGEREYQTTEPLASYEQKLRFTSILRVHRAFLVNLDHIVEIQPWFHSTYHLIMKDGTKVPVSRTYLKGLRDRLGF
mgnify:CR=1 FL=1